MHTRFAAWLMLLAIAVRVLIPQGWMPTKSSDSEGFSLAICSVNGTYKLAGGEHAPPADHDSQSNPMCPYALLGALSSSAEAPAALPPQVQSLSAQPAWTDAPTARWRVHTFGARSPPLA